MSDQRFTEGQGMGRDTTVSGGIRVMEPSNNESITSEIIEQVRELGVSMSTFARYLLNVVREDYADLPTEDGETQQEEA